MPEEEEPVSKDTSRDLLGSADAGPIALRGGALRGAAYAATVALSLISVPLLIRHLGIARFGAYSTALAIATIVGGLTDAGLMNIALREWVNRRDRERAQIMQSLLGIRLELSAAGLVIGVVFTVVAGYPDILVLGTLIAGVGIALQALVHILSAPLQGDLRFGWVSLIDLARQGLAVALIVMLVLVGAAELPLLATSVPAGLLMLVLTARVVRDQTPLRPRLRGTEWWPLVRDALPYSGAIAVSTVYLRLTIVAMSLIASAVQTGYFATSFRVVDVLNSFAPLAIAAAFPILSRASADDHERFAYATDRLIELALIAGAALALGLLLAAPFVIAVIAGSSGAPAAPVLQIQGLAVIATFLVVATSFSLLAMRRHMSLLIANGTALIANLALTVPLVSIDGARGGAIACLVTESLLATGQLMLIVRSGRARPRVSSLLLVGIAFLAGASPMLIRGFQSVPRTIAGLAIYGLALAVLGRFPPEVSHLLATRRPG
jgi:O-antigen/teichoic acid export membrane protein